MEIVVDTTVLIAVMLGEPTKPRLLDLTRGAELISAASLPWEIGNALSAMFKRGRLDEQKAIDALAVYSQIPVRLSPVSIARAVRLSAQLRIYADDAYMVECAQTAGAPLLTLDGGMRDAARRAGVGVVEVNP